MKEGTAGAASTDSNDKGVEDTTDISAQYEIPALEPIGSFASLKERIKKHYELASDYYYSLWGEHIHHGYFTSVEDTKEKAQIQLIELLLSRSDVPKGATVLDVGCGLGGTSRFLAKHHGCHVTGVTISGRQVEMARRISREQAKSQSLASEPVVAENGAIQLGEGSITFLELDAEKMGEYFTTGASATSFDCVWISEAMSHLPDKALFFRNAHLLLKPGGKLVIADWFKAEVLTEAQFEADIRPIEDGMLLPPLCSQSGYVQFAEKAGLKVFGEPMDISQQVAKTWDISWALIQQPALWAFAISQGRDGLAFLQAFRAMRRGYANGSFRYAVMTFQK